MFGDSRADSTSAVVGGAGTVSQGKWAVAQLLPSFISLKSSFLLLPQGLC